MEKVNTCPVCLETEFQFYMNTIDRYSRKNFKLYQCLSCQALVLNPRPSQQEISGFYPPKYEPYNDVKVSKYQEWMWAIHFARLEKIIYAYIDKKPGYVLDIGCARGDFLQTFRQLGWKAEGVEMSDYAASVAREKGLDVFSGTSRSFFKQLSNAKRYDLITMWDVLEHLHEPKEVLDVCREFLSDDGRLVFSVPNMESFDRYIFGSYWLGWESPRHLVLFPRATLEKMLFNAGYRILAIRCISGGSGTFRLSLETVLNNLNNKYLSRWVDLFYPVINIILWPYRQISYLLGRGPILTVIAGKRHD